MDGDAKGGMRGMVMDFGSMPDMKMNHDPMPTLKRHSRRYPLF
jgi:hypothetical protein